MRLICTTNKAYSPDLHVFELQCNWVVRSARRCPPSLPLRRRFPSPSARFLFAAISILSLSFHPSILLLFVMCFCNVALKRRCVITHFVSPIRRVDVSELVTEKRKNGPRKNLMEKRLGHDPCRIESNVTANVVDRCSRLYPANKVADLARD